MATARADIVERLRSLNADFLHEEAADEIERLREALKWFVDNDETNEGDTPLPEYGGRSWNEINAYWIDGLNRARAALGEGREP